MSRFSEEMKVIPGVARVLAVISLLAVPCAGLVYLLLNKRPGGTEWIPLVLIGLAATVMFSIYILIVGYIAGDARRRGMRPALWVLLAFFIPNAIGIILYFILREPLLQHCPKCGAAAKASFTFCAVCGEALSKTCPGCRGMVQPGWSHCARCGASLPAALEMGE